MSNLAKKLFKPALRLAATTSLLAYLALTLDPRALVDTLTGLDAGCWAMAVGLYAASQLVSSYRWARLARAAGFAESDAQAAGHYFAGAFVNLALPTSLGGDTLRALRLARAGGLNDAVLAGCTVAVDRLAGLSSLLLLGAVGLLAVRQGWSGGALTGLALAAFGLHLLAAGLASRLTPRSSDRGRGPQRLLAPYVEQPSVLASAAALSWVVQLLNIATVVWLGAALGLHIPLATYFAAVPAVAVLAGLPLSISGLGAREVGLAALLPVAAEQAASLGLLWFSVVLTTGVAGGIPFALARGTRAAKPIVSPRFTPAPRCGPRVAYADARSMTLSIVIPIYNEIDNVEPLHAALTSVLARQGRPYELLLIDDGSTDGTIDRLRTIAARDSRVKLIEFRRNYGQTAALDAGLRHSTGDVIVTLDADLQNDPADIPLLLAKLDEGYDLVQGWRRDRQDPFWHRKLPSMLANALIAKVTGFAVHDLGCTLKAIRREIAEELRLYGEMHRFIPILAHWQGARVAEVVTRHHPRRAGTSKYGLSRTLRVVLDLITVKYLTAHLQSPMKLFGAVGAGSLAVGVLAGVATIVMKLAGVDMTGNPLLLLSVFLLLAGMQFFVLGMLGELSMRTYYEAQHARPYAIRRRTNFDDAEMRRAA